MFEAASGLGHSCTPSGEGRGISLSERRHSFTRAGPVCVTPLREKEVKMKKGSWGREEGVEWQRRRRGGGEMERVETPDRRWRSESEV